MSSYYSARDSRGYRTRLDITQGTQSIPNNQTPISWALYLECLSTFFQTYTVTASVTIDGSVEFSTATQYVSLPSANSSVLIASGSKTINHLADGSKTLSLAMSFKTNVSGSYGTVGTLSWSGSETLPTIPRTTLHNSFNAFQIESGANINGNLAIYSSTFSHYVQLFQNGVERANWTIAAGPSGSYNYALSLSAAQRDTIFAAMPTLNKQSFSLTVSTFSGATQIGGGQSVAAEGTVPAGYIPTFAAASGSFRFTNKNGALPSLSIKNISTLFANMSGGSASGGASLSSYQIRFQGDVHTGAYSGAAIAEQNMGLIVSAGTLYVYYQVVDSRGRPSTEVSKAITILDYSPPVSNGFDVTRNAAAPTSADFLLKFISSLYAQGNTWWYTPYYWNGSAWVAAKAETAITAATIDAIYTHSLPYSESLVYNMKVVVRDLFNSQEYTDTLPTTAFVLSYGKRGIGVGRDTSDTYDLEVGTGGIKSDGPIIGYVPTKTRTEWFGSGVINYIVGMLPWKHYGNGHTIFDASAGTSPSGSAIDKSNSVDAWVASYPNLMGWNGSSTYGVKVDRSRLAERVLVDAIYPIGSIYMSVVGTDPGTLFGGTWTTFANGRALVGVYGADADFNLPEKFGGEKTHVLSIAEMPAHGHGGVGNANDTIGTVVQNRVKTNAQVNYDGYTAVYNTGGGGAHNNMPPYMVVYMWKRTA